MKNKRAIAVGFLIALIILLFTFVIFTAIILTPAGEKIRETINDVLDQLRGLRKVTFEASIGDLGGDVDLAVVRSVSDANQIITFRTDYNILSFGETFCGKAGCDWDGIAVGNFDDEGTDDIALVRSSKGQEVLVYTANGNELYKFGKKFCGMDTGCDWRGIAAGDFDGDGIDNIILVRKEDKNPEGLIYSADGMKIKEFGQEACGMNVGCDWRGVAVGDFDGDDVDDFVRLRKSDTDNDILVRKYTDGRITKIKDFDIKCKSSLTQTTMACDWRGIATGDFDNDGVNDIALVRRDSNEQEILLYYANGTKIKEFGRGACGMNTGCDWRGIAAGDFNGDGVDEVAVVRNEPGDQILIYDKGGKNILSFGEKYCGDAGCPWGGIAAGQFVPKPEVEAEAEAEAEAEGALA